MQLTRMTLLILMLILAACGPAQTIPASTTNSEITLPTATTVPPTPTATIEPTVTVDVVTAEQTVLNFRFPFEPSFPGYLVEIQSDTLTADLICALPREGGENGRILDMDDVEAEPLGRCDASSMTLDQLILDEMTVTVILGGHPIVLDVTKSADTLSGQGAIYNF